jgi:hypothetical protein
MPGTHFMQPLKSSKTVLLALLQPENQPHAQGLLGMARERRKPLVKYAEISKILRDLSHAQ